VGAIVEGNRHSGRPPPAYSGLRTGLPARGLILRPHRGLGCAGARLAGEPFRRGRRSLRVPLWL